jgi:hypothetical protein
MVLAALEEEIRRVTALDHPWKNVRENPSQPTSQAWHTCAPSHAGGHRLEDHSLRLALGQKSKTLPKKMTKAKKGQGLTQLVEHLLNKHKDLS